MTLFYELKSPGVTGCVAAVEYVTVRLKKLSIATLMAVYICGISVIAVFISSSVISKIFVSATAPVAPL